MADLLKNKSVGFNYDIEDKLEAGLDLLGTEVKALREGRGSLIGSYIIIRGGEAFLVNAEIPPHQEANAPEDYDLRRPRKLLLTKKELQKLAELENARGLTLAPIAVYNKGRNLKISFAVARGKKARDKRQTIKKREADREIHRSLKKLR
jgi:SsrA-binding protein